MTLTYRLKPTKSSLLMIVFSACLLATGCGGKKQQAKPASPVVLSKQLSSPSLSYLSNDMVETGSNSIGVEQWMTIAKNNYESKKYARALRAATEALNIDNGSVAAREMAMLSAVRVTQSNIDAYSDNALLNDYDKAELRDTFADITSLINTP